MKIAISGYDGFLGSHLLNTLVYKKGFEKSKFINIEKEDFNNSEVLKNKLRNCHIIVHLAAVNRHQDLDFLYQENIRLTKCIIKNISKVTKTIIFASSVQQDLNNPFGKSKLKCVQLFKKWAVVNNSRFVNLKIPNVFGPFGTPNYNSFVATFCYNLIFNKKCEINNGNKFNLLYIDYLIESFYSLITDSIKTIDNKVTEISNFNGIVSISVKEVFNILETQWNVYKNNVIPNISSAFERNLFNTLRSFIPLENFYPKKLIKHVDERGFFSEIIRTNSGGQFSISSTNSGITRGNHFHTRKVERFIVIQGNALVELRKIGSNKKISIKLDGKKLNHIDIPIWYTHSITNIGDETLVTLFWINEPYDSENSDTYLIKV